MKSIVKLLCISSISLGLSACSYSQNVLQGVYDSKADYDCRDQLNEDGSIHSDVKSACSGTTYDSNKNRALSAADKSADWKQESERKNKSRIDTYGN